MQNKQFKYWINNLIVKCQVPHKIKAKQAFTFLFNSVYLIAVEVKSINCLQRKTRNVKIKEFKGLQMQQNSHLIKLIYFLWHTNTKIS